MKTRNPLVLGAIAAALLVPASAQAQDAHGFGSQTQLILSADRLVPVFAYSSTTITRTDDGRTVKDNTSGSSTSLLFGRDLGPGSVHTVPRVGFDFVVIPHLTIGGAVAFGFTLGGSREVESNQGGQTVRVKTDAPSQTVIGLAPRVGYIIPFGDLVAFWPRGGFGFYSQRITTEENDNNGPTRDTFKSTIFSLDIDPQFVFVPMEHFFFNVGPLLNIPLTGSVTNERVRGATTTSVDNDLSVWHLGITAGLGGWFNL